MSHEQNTTSARKQSCGNDGAVESLENQPQVFHPSHRPWKSRRDFHIPTAPTTNPIYLLRQTRTAAGLRPWPTELTVVVVAEREK
jgi:hypothetical protein